MPKYYNQTDALVWVQPGGVNTVCEMLDCHDIADVVVPKGGVERSYCIDPATGRFVPGVRRQGPGGSPTTSLTAHIGLNKDWLEQIQNCPTTIYIHKAPCGDRRNFLNYERSYTLRYAIFTQQTLSNLAMLMSTTGAPGESTQAFDVDIDVKKDTFKLLMTGLTTAETEDGLDIAFCNTEQCAGYCGPGKALCTEGVIVYAAAAGNTANVEYTTNGGATWTAATGAGPFDAEEDIVSVVCFAVGDGTRTRWVVARDLEAAPATPAEIAWSDDSGTTWNVVTVGTTNGEGGQWCGALFALDHRHIWFVTNQGNIFFSEDGALSWTEQGVGVTGNALNYVRFVDYHFGLAVGATNTVLFTRDGGRHWNSLAGPSVANLLCCTIFDGHRAWVADDAGHVWYTDVLALGMVAGDWSERLLDTPTGAVSTDRINDIMFVRESGFQTDDHCGYLVTKWTEDGAYHGAIYRTINGGYDWEIWYTATMDAPVEFGLNAVWACGQNQAFATGTPISALATIIELNGALP